MQDSKRLILYMKARGASTPSLRILLEGHWWGFGRDFTLFHRGLYTTTPAPDDAWSSGAGVGAYAE